MRRSCLVGALAAAGALAASGSMQMFTFMADDYVHLCNVYREDGELTGAFSAWLPRVPVWALAASVLFSSHVLERAWWPVAAFFLCHCLGVAALVATFVAQLPAAAPRRGEGAWLALLTAVLCFYANHYEVLSWPTCMPYALGALFLGLASLAARRWAQAVWICLAMLTYETFVLPAAVVLLLPALLRTGRSAGTAAGRALATWAGCLGAVVALRAAFALRFGAFHHLVGLAPAHVVGNIWTAVLGLVRFRHHHMHTNVPATLCCGLVLLASLVHGRWRRYRAWAPWLACLAATGLSWFLTYGALRSIYGAQLLLCATLAWALHRLWREPMPVRLLAPALLAGLAVGFGQQHVELATIKATNARALRRQESRWAETLARCEAPCRLLYDSPREGLAPDWVLPDGFVPAYFEWLRRKYAPGKQVDFVARAESS